VPHAIVSRETTLVRLRDELDRLRRIPSPFAEGGVRQNLLNGPPIPAPPSFLGLALAGQAALGLLDDRPDG
jgi:hypothetical protein